jgi:hypothetical protein
MEDIVLVTGCHLARSFANIAFAEDRGEGRVSFEVRTPGGSHVEWRFPLDDIQGVALNLGPNGPVRLLVLFLHLESSVQTKSIRIFPKISVYSSEGIVLLGFWGYYQGFGEQPSRLKVQMKMSLNLTCIS